ncbi:phage baseplate protein [Methanolacinia petrolearia]|uniref:phage baseplate protein n=1 Tax=Methanolacinia petrolearia TaxID=54120 RepID=UPI003BAC7E78
MATEDIVLIYDNVRTVLETVSEVSYSDSLEVPQHKNAAQYSISDHIIRNPVSVTLKMTVLKDAIDTLVSLKNQKKRLKFISESPNINGLFKASGYTHTLRGDTYETEIEVAEA